jgi:hypothetical protein
MSRDPLDRYYTPAWMVDELCERVDISGDVLEVCSGRGDLAAALERNLCGRGVEVLTNDLDPASPAQTHHDARTPQAYQRRANPRWVVTNPPFRDAVEILKTALVWVQVDVVCMLLRLSFVEPTSGRARLLNMFPPDGLIVLPRWSFNGCGSDSVTCAWMVWGYKLRPAVQVASRVKMDAYREWMTRENQHA